MTLDRRRLLLASPAVGLGISTLALPGAASAASLAGVTLSTQGPSSITVDDTGTAASGHDVALRIRLVGSAGGPATGNIRIDVTVTLDDGADGGAGSPPTGTRIDGVVRTTFAVLAESGGADVSIDLPAAGTYLFTVTCTPAALNQPDGVVLAYAFAG